MATGVLRRRRRRFNAFDVFVLTLCIGFAFACFYPMWYVVLTSVTPYDDVVRHPIRIIPQAIDLQYYKAILSSKALLRSLGISVVKTVCATALSLLITSSMAYGVSKTHVKGMKVINAIVVLTLFLQGGLIPQYLLYKDIGILRTFWVMVLPGALNVVYFIIMRNYFSYSIPKEIEEAATIDGCNDVTIFFRIVIPLSKPMFAAVGMFVAVFNWNDYYSYLMFISNRPELQPFAWALRQILVDPSMMQQVQTEAAGRGLPVLPPIELRTAAIVLAMLPILVIYPFLQRYFSKGMLLGAVKD